LMLGLFALLAYSLADLLPVLTGTTTEPSVMSY
jgi:hypothetical protein